MAKKVRLKIQYVDCLLKAFEHNSRKKVIAKGRRLGLTRNMAQWMIENMLQRKIMCLWGDTLAGNISRYIERYWMPILEQLPKEIWRWDKKENKMHINKSVCDFRSADIVENWEGFGYDIIFLNEAGIILKNRYLWENAVRPMLLDSPTSIAVIGGTPKGKNLFFELWQRGNLMESGWMSWQFSSYENPFLDRKEIEDMEQEMPAHIVRQEIYGEFLDSAEEVLIPYDIVIKCMNQTVDSDMMDGAVVWGLDSARSKDKAVLCKRKGYVVYEIKEIKANNTMELISKVNFEYLHDRFKPDIIFIEVSGMGYPIYDRMHQLGLPVYPADTGLRSAKEKIKNKRAEMYWNLFEAMQKGLVIPKHKILKQELVYVPVEYDNRGNMKIMKKEKLVKELGHSPDFADALALTFYEEITVNRFSGAMPTFAASY